VNHTSVLYQIFHIIVASVAGGCCDRQCQTLQLYQEELERLGCRYGSQVHTHYPAAYRLYSRSVCDDSVLEDDYFLTIHYTKIHFHFSLMRSEYTLKSAVSVEIPRPYSDWQYGNKEWIPIYE